MSGFEKNSENFSILGVLGAPRIKNGLLHIGTFWGSHTRYVGPKSQKKKLKNLKNVQKPSKMGFGINLGQKSVFSGIFDPGAENWPFSRKWAFWGPKRAILGSIFGLFGRFLTFLTIKNKSHKNPF